MELNKVRSGPKVGELSRGSGPVHKLREATGLSQRDFAAEVGISRPTVQVCEREGKAPTKLARDALIAYARKKGFEFEE